MRWMLGGFVLHLILVALIAAHFEAWPAGVAGRALALYQGLTGINTRYGFFAPNVGTNLRVLFDVRGADGRVRRETLGDGMGRESTIRVNNMAGLFGRFVGDAKLQRSLTASWAARIFLRDPGARAVRVIVEVYQLPAMAEYREGRRPHWRKVYEGDYVHPTAG